MFRPLASVVSALSSGVAKSPQTMHPFISLPLLKPDVKFSLIRLSLGLLREAHAQGAEPAASPNGKASVSEEKGSGLTGVSVVGQLTKRSSLHLTRRVQGKAPSLHGNYPASPLLWASPTPAPAPARFIYSPAGSVSNHRRSGSPRFLGRSFRTRHPQPPRQARRLLVPVSSSPAAGFATVGRLAALRLNLTRPNRVHLRYGSRVRSAGLRRRGSLLTPPASLPVERAIDRTASSQAARSTRLGLAHLLRLKRTKIRFLKRPEKGGGSNRSGYRTGRRIGFIPFPRKFPHPSPTDSTRCRFLKKIRKNLILALRNLSSTRHPPLPRPYYLIK